LKGEQAPDGFRLRDAVIAHQIGTHLNIIRRKCYAVYGRPSYSLAAVRTRDRGSADYAICAPDRAQAAPGAEQLPEFYRWTVDHPEEFWSDVWDFCGVIASRRGSSVLVDGDKMPGRAGSPRRGSISPRT